MSEFVVVDSSGRFLSHAGRSFTGEYPDARTFEAKGTAIKAARYTKVLCDVVEDYGLDSEKVVATVEGEQG